MTSLPSQGGSVGGWGTELNAWLESRHNADGSHGPQNGITAVLNVKDPAYGATGGGVADDYPALQAALTAAAASNGVVYVPKGVYLTSQVLEFSSGTEIYGDGMGATVIRAKSGYAATQVGSNPGMIMLGTTGDGSSVQSHITVRDLTVDMNEANVAFPLPSYSSQNECSPLAFTGVNYLTIRNVEVINSVGYAILPRNCSYVTIEDNVVFTGQAVVQTYVTKDAIHVIDCSYVKVTGNILNTGSLTNPANGDANVGDDCICIQGVSAGSAHVTISGNVIQASGARGIALVLGGAAVTDVAVTGNVIANTQHEGIVLEYGEYNPASTYLISNVTVTGNAFFNLALSGSGRGITVDDASNVAGHSGPGWSDVAISNNVFKSFTNTSGGGIYIGQGSNIQVNGNTFDKWNCVRGIQVGDNTSGSSRPVTGFQVSGNTVNMAASAASGPFGIIIIDSTEGVIANNVILGPSRAAGSTGIGVLAIGTPVTGVTVTGNAVNAWAQAVSESNDGAAPDYNLYTANNCHGNTNFIATVGAHDVVANNVTA